MLCHVLQVQIGFFDGLDVAPVEAVETMAYGEKDPVMKHVLLEGRQPFVSAVNGAVAVHGGVDEMDVRPAFAEAAVDEEEDVQVFPGCVDKGFFIFPIEKGDGVSLGIIGDVSKGRAPVMKTDGVKSGEALSGQKESAVPQGFIFRIPGYVWERGACRFHDKVVVLQADDMWCQREILPDNVHFIDLAPEGCIHTGLGETVSPIGQLSF